MPNSWGGWWYRDPDNRFTIQILPSNTIHESRDWKLGIARPRRGMKWGKMSFPAPEAAVFQASRVVDDIALADMLAEAMRAGQDERMQEIGKRIKRLKEGNR